MKLIGLLKDKVDAANTKEEIKTILEDVGIELTDDELVAVAGGLEFHDILGNRLEKSGSTAEDCDLYPHGPWH